MIGEGGFGVVLRGEHKLDKGICAIKIIKLKDVRDKESIINEARTMIKLTNKHVVHYKYCLVYFIIFSINSIVRVKLRENIIPNFNVSFLFFIIFK